MQGTFYDAALVALLDEGAWTGPYPSGSLPHVAFDGAGQVDVIDDGEPWNCTFTSQLDSNRWKLKAKCDEKNAGIGNTWRWTGEKTATLQLAGTQSDLVQIDASPEEMLAQLLETAGEPVQLGLQLGDYSSVKMTGDRHHTVKVEEEKKPRIWSEDVTLAAELATQGNRTSVKQNTKSTNKDPGSEEHLLSFTLGQRGGVFDVKSTLIKTIDDPAKKTHITKVLGDEARRESELHSLTIVARSLPKDPVGLGDTWKRKTLGQETSCRMQTLSHEDSMASLDCAVKADGSLLGNHRIEFDFAGGRPMEVNWSQKRSSVVNDKKTEGKHTGADKLKWTK